MNLYKKIRNQKKEGVLWILIISSLFSVGLIIFRMIFTLEYTFIFLVWNLFLAWLPFIISFIYSLYEKKIKSKLILFLTVVVWLPLFPNAPYIITDLFHLWQKPGMPLWFDLILILSFAWNGLILGFVSLIILQRAIKRKFNNFISWNFAIVAIFAGSFGIYIGRYLRWNSWDIISNPFALARDMLDILIHPFSNIAVYGMTIFFSCFFILGYLTVKYLNLRNIQM